MNYLVMIKAVKIIYHYQATIRVDQMLIMDSSILLWYHNLSGNYPVTYKYNGVFTVYCLPSPDSLSAFAFFQPEQA